MPKQQSTPTGNPLQNCGYRAGLLQPGLTLTLNIEPQLAVRREAVAQQLQHSFAVAPTPWRGCNPEDFDQSTRNSAELAWQILLLASSLLQAVRVPAFDAGRIVAARPLASQVAIEAVVPWIEHLDAKILLRTFHAAAYVVKTLAKEGSGNGVAEILLRDMHEKFIKPTLKLVPGGDSTIPALANAHHRGIPFRHLSGGVYLLGWGKKARLLDRSAVESDSAIGAKLSTNKYYTANLLHAAGLPAPKHFWVRNEDEALAAARKLGWPVVVKPLDRERGEGVVVDVRDETHLLAAYASAAKLSRGVLVERQVEGVCHRVYVSHGKVLYATKRLPKLVTGDGVHTVAELIAQANAKEQSNVPWRRLKPFSADEEARQCLAAAGLALDSIPAEGVQAPLRRVEATIWGGVTEDRSEAIHAHNLEIAVRAAQLFKLDSAGIDIITPDIGVPWHENGAIINEVNFAPLIGSHRTGYKLDGSIAQIIANLIDGDGRIPVQVIVGKHSLDAALQRQKTCLAENLKCHVASHQQAHSPDGEQVHLAADGLFARCQALLMHGSLEALIIAVQTDEFVSTGLPIDRIERLTVLDDDVMDWRDQGQMASQSARQDLLDLLESYTFAVTEDAV